MAKSLTVPFVELVVCPPIGIMEFASLDNGQNYLAHADAVLFA
jgi:hypothetical protein